MRAAAILLAASSLWLGACASSSSGNGDDDSGMTEIDAGPDAARPFGDAVPVGAVSFFRAAACPTGWRAYTPATGRTLVPAPDDDPDAGSLPGPIAVGTPLSSGENRAHGHTMSATLTLPATSYAGVAGSGNGGLSPAGTVTVNATSTTSAAGPPYVQLLVCEKTAPPMVTARPMPKGVLMFFNDPCPAGWTRATIGKGRFLVGIPSGGLAGTYGGPALHPGENREHTHPWSGMVATTSHGIALAGGCCGGGYAANGTYPFSGTTTRNSAGFPYLALAQCAKD